MPLMPLSNRKASFPHLENIPCCAYCAYSFLINNGAQLECRINPSIFTQKEYRDLNGYYMLKESRQFPIVNPDDSCGKISIIK